MMDHEIFAAFHEQPYILPWEHVQTSILGTIAVSVSSTLLFSIFLNILIPRLNPALPNPSKVSYQMTNFVVNTCLGFMGVYYLVFKLPKNPTIEEQVLGFESLHPMSSLQLGFQLWAIGVGLFLVNESPQMITHHCSVVIVTGMSSFFNMGFRYYTPFMYGVLELSSLPLAVMNAFKDNPKWIERYPSTYSMARFFFAASFLFIRWYMYLPRKYSFLRVLCLALVTSRSLPFRVYYGGVFVSSFFLLCLQLLWGSLIMKGLLKTAMSPKKLLKE